MPLPRTSPQAVPGGPGPAPIPDDPHSVWRRLGYWVTGSTMAAVIISLLVHLGGIILAANLLLGGPGGTGSPRGASDIELAVVTDTELTDLQESVSIEPDPALSFEESSLDESLATPEFEAQVTDESLLGQDLGQIAPIGGAGEGLGEGAGLGANVGGGGASFFGVEAQGSRFAYIVDISGSMADKRLAALQRELTRSIDGLLEHSSFAVVFYSNTARILGGRMNWMRANQRHKTLADREIRAVAAGGGTDPTTAFEIVFNMRPRPDAIYFMTDGEFPRSVAAVVAQLNESGGQRTPVHCISFIERTSEQLLRSIAEQSGGTYTHIPEAGL